ncbi:MAG: ABC transporter permease [Polyangiaceae bacterium]
MTTPSRLRVTLGGTLVILLVVFATLGPLVSSHDPYVSEFGRALAADETPVGPGAAFWFGADRLFRDVFTRLAVGGRLSLAIAVAATAVATTTGTIVGLVAGTFEGKAADHALMRLVDVGLAFPFLLVVMAVGAAVDRTSATTILLTLGFTGWLGTARIVRAKTLGIRRKEFVAASRALGQSELRIVVLHVLPNLGGALVVLATTQVAQMILAESVLGWLGAGIAPPVPTWGAMLAEGQDQIQAAPWLVVAPASALVAAVLGFTLLGEGLRDALDPPTAR